MALDNRCRWHGPVRRQQGSRDSLDEIAGGPPQLRGCRLHAGRSLLPPARLRLVGGSLRSRCECRLCSPASPGAVSRRGRRQLGSRCRPLSLAHIAAGRRVPGPRCHGRRRRSARHSQERATLRARDTPRHVTVTARKRKGHRAQRAPATGQTIAPSVHRVSGRADPWSVSRRSTTWHLRFTFPRHAPTPSAPQVRTSNSRVSKPTPPTSRQTPRVSRARSRTARWNKLLPAVQALS